MNETEPASIVRRCGKRNSDSICKPAMLSEQSRRLRPLTTYKVSPAGIFSVLVGIDSSLQANHGSATIKATIFAGIHTARTEFQRHRDHLAR